MNRDEVGVDAFAHLVRINPVNVRVVERLKRSTLL